jgi:hypothetical protein
MPCLSWVLVRNMLTNCIVDRKYLNEIVKAYF